MALYEIIYILLACQLFFLTNFAAGYNVLLATMGGTKSHTVPFVALGTILKVRGHNVTLFSAFTGPAANNALTELVPPVLEAYVGNYTSEWDLVGSRFRNELPLSPWDAMRYGWESCEALLKDKSSISSLRKPNTGNQRSRWDVAVLDGAYPECLLAILHKENIPTIMLNTVALYTGSINRQGSPSPWSITPYFGKALTQDMNFIRRIINVACLMTLEVMHWIMITGYLQPILHKQLGEDVPDVRDLIAEVPLTFQNSHYTVADAVPHLPNVVNVACLHCRRPTHLSTELESFLRRGFIFVSMGSSVRAAGMPDALREIFIAAFSTLPYNVVWKWEGIKIENLPPNVRIAAWWPQQELLGHKNLKGFVSHGGLLSLHEAAFHGAPTLVLPVFCDHDGNAAQAEKHGYALLMDLASISATALREGILKIASPKNNPYREAAKRTSMLLRDLPISPQDLATWWIEHVAKYSGADHVKSTSRHMTTIRYYSIDVGLFYLCFFTILIYTMKKFTIRLVVAKGSASSKVTRSKID